EGELHLKLSNLTSADKPLLVFFGYQGKLEGGPQRTRGPRTVSFAILYVVPDPNDYATQRQRINDAESIGLEIIARINYDSTPEGAVDWLYNTFVKDSVQFEKVEYKAPMGLFGQEFFFDLDVKNPLKPTEGFWKDKSFC